MPFAGAQVNASGNRDLATTLQATMDFDRLHPGRMRLLPSRLLLALPCTCAPVRTVPRARPPR